MLNSTDIKQLTEEIDNILASVAMKYEIGPLSLSALVLARLLAIHRECGSEADFRELVEVAFKMRVEESYANYSQH